MIIWGHPWWLLALIVPLALLVAELLIERRRRRERGRFASRELWPRLAPGTSRPLVRVKRVVFLVALALLAVGIANPRIGTRYEEVVREGIDIVLAVDVSRSMDSQDIRPSRIGKTRYELARFIEGLKGDRVGIVPFAGTAYPLLPLTLDYAAAKTFVDLLSTDLIPNPGTALAEAIEVAARSFPDEQERAKVIVIVSDGEDHEGNAVKAVRDAAADGIRVFTIGMAKEKGDPIPVYDADGRRTGWLTDEEGQIVTSRLNEQILREIAQAGNGEYRRAGQGGGAFRDLYRELFRLERGEFEARRITGHEDRFQPLLIAALVLLLLQFALPDGRRRRSRQAAPGAETETRNSERRTMGKRTTAAILVLSLTAGFVTAAFSAETPHHLVKKGNSEVVDGNLDEALENYIRAQSKLDTTRPELLYNFGGVYARKGNLGRADSLYRSLAPDAGERLRGRAQYNRGTAFAGAQQYDQAIPALIDALKRNPDDEDAKINLEFALRKMQEQKQQQKQQDNQKNNDQKQNEDRQKQKNEQNRQNEQNQQQQNQNQQRENEPQREDKQQQPPQPQNLNREMAKRLLDQMKQDEKELLKRVVRKQVPKSRKGTKKPW